MAKKKWTEDGVRELMVLARAAGHKAAKEKLEELQDKGPAFQVVQQKNAFGPPSDEDKVVGTMLDVCGFAHLTGSALKGNTSLGRQLRKLHQSDRVYYSTGSYGPRLSVFDMTMRQEMSVNAAANEAVRQVMEKAGVEGLYVVTQID